MGSVIYASGYSLEQLREVAGSLYLPKRCRPSAILSAVAGFGIAGRR